jgi:hypothetical protein
VVVGADGFGQAVTRARKGSADCAVAAGLCLLLSSVHAQANGRFPQADQLLIAPDRPEALTLRSTFGLLLSRDSGDTWDWLCERAVGYSGTEDPTLAALAGGVVIAGLEAGLSRSDASGCSWDFATADLAGSPVVDLSVRKDSPSHALALIWERQTGSVGAAYRSRFFATSDNGLSFAPHGNGIDPSVLVLTIDLAPSDPRRVYASGVRSVDGVREGFLFVSGDGAETWVAYPVPFDSALDQGVYIAAVDPREADVVYLRTSSLGPSQLLVTRDAGSQFDVVFSGSPIVAFALSPDGSRVYFGGDNGLLSALTSDFVVEKRASARLLCLAASGDTLFACSDEHSGFTVGASKDEGFTFEPKLHLSTVRGPLACGADTSATGCAADWPDVSTQLGIPTAGGAGGSAGGAGPPSSAPGACALGRQRPKPALSLFWLGLSLAALSRRRGYRRGFAGSP